MPLPGFFTKKETASTSRPDGKVRSCASCGLYKTSISPRMKPYGEFRKGIVVMGEASGEVEDRTGKPFQGKTGRLLQRTLEKLGVDLFRDCLCINACLCRPINDEGENRTPLGVEIESCRSTNIRVIQEHMPKVIILLGNSAVFSLIGHRWKNSIENISTWRGWTIPDQDFKAWICPTFHPSFVERSDKGAEKKIWETDLAQALSKVEQPLIRYKKPIIEYISDLNVLDSITSDLIAFDFETTGIKPYAKGHRIVCVSVADSEDHAYVFLLPPTKKERSPLIRLLKNESVGKMAHNMKFENTWSKIRLGVDVRNWTWDSMLAAHLLDNRSGITGLKFQTYVNFGIVDYASEVSPYLRSEEKHGNALNRIMSLLESQTHVKSLLEYCALDSIYEYRLARHQQTIMNYSFLPF